MDNREEMSPAQPESGVRYTIDELLVLMEPQHREDQNTTRKCIAGLTGYAAQLAAKHQEEQIPQLRKLCIGMAEFWGLAEDDTWEAYWKMEAQYGGAFDSAVSAARDSGHAPELSDQTRQEILEGLEIYTQELKLNGGLEQWVAECGSLSEQLQMSPVQPESGVHYTIDELLTLMEPQHREDQNATRKCIAGLTGYAAQLAAKHQEEQIPQLRTLCISMAEFWGLAEDDTWEGFREMEEQYGGAFDSAVSAARDSGHAPELSDQTRQEILEGLELYAQEMTLNGGLEQWVAECGSLSEQLQLEWQTEAQVNMEMGGM